MVREVKEVMEKSRKILGQEKVREFCLKSGKNFKIRVIANIIN